MKKAILWSVIVTVAIATITCFTKFTDKTVGTLQHYDANILLFGLAGFGIAMLLLLTERRRKRRI